MKGVSKYECQPNFTAKNNDPRDCLLFKKAQLPLDTALDFFYRSELYPLLRDGVSDMHCMSDDYLADELLSEYRPLK